MAHGSPPSRSSSATSTVAVMRDNHQHVPCKQIDDAMVSPPSRSASTIVAVRNHHVLKIDGYSRTLTTDGSRPAFSSRPFHAGGRAWRISYRPMGSAHHPDNTDSVAFYLVLDDIVDEPVMAQFTLSLLDQAGAPVHSHTRTTQQYDFSTSRDRAVGYERFLRRDNLRRSEYLRDDCFAVRVHVYVLKQAPSVAVPPPDMHLHLGELLASGEDADVEFRVGGETFAAHRLVLGARSPVLMAQLFGPMKKGVTAMANNKSNGTTIDIIQVQVDDMEARAFEHLLAFIYTDTWPDDETTEEEDACAITQHLLVAADRYGLQKLKLMCEDRLLTGNHIDAGSVADILALAEQHCCYRLKEACFEFLASSTTDLFAVIQTRGFEHLARSCPSAVKELTRTILLRRDLEEAKISSSSSGDEETTGSSVDEWWRSTLAPLTRKERRATAALSLLVYLAWNVWMERRKPASIRQ